MDRAIRFLLNGTPVDVTGVAPTTTLLDWLRETRRLTGTKEGCNEGDCGACTVAVRRLVDGRVATRPLNACIQLLPMLHGTEVVTIEGIEGPDGALHPVQRTMADLHGSQCGFCTPGFVMTQWTAYRTEPGCPDVPRINDLLAGNLCRCTGYGPILAATQAAWDQPAPAWDAAEEEVAERHAALDPGPLSYEHGGQRFEMPEDLEGLAGLVADHPEATVLAGATDVGLWVTKHDFDPDMVICLNRVAALAEITEADGMLSIGAGVTYAAAEARIGALWPAFGALIRRIGGGQVRAAGTIGGNIANGSPIGDSPPALIALGARLVLRHRDTEREIPLEDFFLDYGKQDRRPGEIVTHIRVPLPEPHQHLACNKVSKRFDQDITAVLGCFDIRVSDGVVSMARLAYGGMAGVPKRAARAEAALVGRPWTRATVEAAMRAMADDFMPLTDMRASEGYRATVAANLLLRHYLERTEPAVPARLVG